MNLTFHDKKFILTNFDTTKVPKSSGWIFDPAKNIYTTKNIEAAYAFEKHASNSVKNIFQNLMITNVPGSSVTPLIPDNLKLKEFQEKRGVPFLLSQNKTYLAHQPGLGKSAQFVAAVNTNPGRAFLSPPSFLKTNWAREISKWSTGFPHISIIQNTSKQHKVDWKADYVICPHAMLSKQWVIDGILKTDFKYKGIDEVQGLKSTTAARSIALWGGQSVDEESKVKFKSPGLMRDCDHEIYLSGTPLLSRPAEIYPILYGAAPEVIDFMSYQDFGFRYCGAWQDKRGAWQFTGSSREEELHRRLVKKFMQIIQKKDVLKDLPEKIRSVLVMDGDPRDAEAKKLDRELLRTFTDEGKLRPGSMGMYAKLHHINGLAKVNWSAELINFYLNNDPTESIILYGYHRDVCEKLFERLKHFKPDIILGGLTDIQRIKIVDRFQSRANRLIIGNEAMNLGHTLTAASRTVHAEYSTLPKVNEQAEDRTNRIGSTGAATYHQYIVLPNSIDEARLRSFHRREVSINKIIY